MSQDYTEEQKAAIHAVNQTLTQVDLPTYSALEEKLFQTLAACTESISMGKRLYQELTAKRQTAITKENLPAFTKAFEQALAEKKERFFFEGQDVLISYAKYVIEYVTKH